MLLNDKQLLEIQENLKTSTKKLNELKEQHADHTKKISDIHDSISSKNDEIKKLEGDKIGHNNMLVKIANEHNPLNVSINKLEKQISEHERKVAINTMVEKQPKFYDVMLKRLVRLQDDLSDCGTQFITFIEPKEAVEKIKKAANQQGFSQSTLDLRSGLENYNRLIRDMCTERVDGGTVTLEQSKRNIDSIDKWLMIPIVSQYWKSEA